MSDLKLEAVSSEALSPDNVREVCKGSDGKMYERLTQKIDKKTGMLASRSRSLNPEIVENVLVRPLPEEVVKEDKSNPSQHLSEEERMMIVAEKMQKIEDKKARAEEAKRIAHLDEDDEAEEDKKSEKQRELDKEVIERNQQAAKNVDEIRNLQADLKAQGKSAKEVKAAVNELKAEQKKRGRPAAEALKNPVKDPQTGEFVEDESGE